MNTVRQGVSRIMNDYRNGAATDVKKEIMLLLYAPTNPAVVTPSTQSLGKPY